MARNTLTTFPGVATRDGEIGIPRNDYARHTVSFIDERCTKAKCCYPNELNYHAGARKTRTKSICRIDNKKEDGQASSVPSGSLQVDLEGLVNALVVQFAQDSLGSESLGSANSGDNFLGNATTFSSVLEGQSGTSVNFVLRICSNGRHVLHVG